MAVTFEELVGHIGLQQVERANPRSAAPQELVDAKRRRRMEEIDKMPADLRELVHAYGLTVVRALMDCGVKKPNQIRHVVETILDEFSPTRSTRSFQGPRAHTLKAIEMTVKNPVGEGSE